MEQTPSPSSSSTPSVVSTRPIFLSVSLVLVALIISGSIIASAVIKDRGAERDSEISRSMMLTGYASREVTSDRMKWSITIARNSASNSAPSETSTSSTMSATKEDMIALVKKDVEQVLSLLAAAGVQNPTVSRHPMESHSYTNGGSYYDTTYYGSTNDVGASQIVVIESTDVEKMNDATGNIISKITSGGATVSQNTTEFFYSKTDDLRRELTEEALNDAKKQAQKVGGDKLGSLLQITGNTYLQLTPVNASANSYYGGNEDTSSIKKKAALSVSVSYAIKK